MNIVRTVDNMDFSPYDESKEYLVDCNGRQYSVVLHSGKKYEIDIYTSEYGSIYFVKDKYFGLVLEYIGGIDTTELVTSYTFKSEEERDDFFEFLCGNFEEMIGDNN